MDKNIIKSIKDRPTIKLAGIDPQSGVNGDGIRAVYFSQGCPHHCKGCFNPET
jgi:anaerobic ribonucleoside-triphosphate reductase activating protein